MQKINFKDSNFLGLSQITKFSICWSFFLLNVASTVVNLFSIYWAFATSLTCKANALSTNISHRWIDLCIQITKGGIYFNGDSSVKNPCWHQVLTRWPSGPDLLWFTAEPPLKDLVIFMAPHGWAPFKWPVLLGYAFQRSPASCPEQSPDFPRACCPSALQAIKVI